MTRIAAVHGALAPHRRAQSEITDMVARACLPEGTDRGVLDRLHRSARVDSRHMTLPLDQYEELDGFGAANDVFIASATDLGGRAVRDALRMAGLSAADVDLLIFTSVSGISTPSIDARLAVRLGLRRDVRRLPMFGLGCAGGAAGLARMHDYLVGRNSTTWRCSCRSNCARSRSSAMTPPWPTWSPPGCSATGPPQSSGSGHTARPRPCGPTIVDTRSHLYPDTGRLLGWDVGDSGFRVVLDPRVPDVIRRHLADDVEGFLGDHGLKTKDVTAWVCHPGGPKVLEAVTEALDLPCDALDMTWRHLAEVGNLSSSSVLHVLRDTLADRRPPPGTPGVLLAMGPGFACELVLLRW